MSDNKALKRKNPHSSMKKKKLTILESIDSERFIRHSNIVVTDAMWEKRAEELLAFVKDATKPNLKKFAILKGIQYHTLTSGWPQASERFRDAYEMAKLFIAIARQELNESNDPRQKLSDSSFMNYQHFYDGELNDSMRIKSELRIEEQRRIDENKAKIAKEHGITPTTGPIIVQLPSIEPTKEVTDNLASRDNNKAG